MVESLEEEGPSAAAAPTAAARRKRKRKRTNMKGKGKAKKKKGNGKGKEKKKKDKGKTKEGGICGAREDYTCIANIVKVLDHVGTVVTYFLSQEARQARFRTLVKNKKGKANNFEATSTLLEDSKIRSATCGPK